MKRPASLFALCAAVVALQAVSGDMVFWPKKATLDVDHYNWSDVDGWWQDRTKYQPSTAVGQCPGTDDSVYITMSPLTNTPLVISSAVSISNFYLAASVDSHGAWPDGYAQGTWMRMTGGTLDVQSFVFANNNAFWGKFDLEGGTMNVASSVNLGVNATATEWSRLTVGDTAEFNVAGDLLVGSRSTKAGFAVTNEGSIVCQTLKVGPASSSYDGTGVVYNAGSIRASGDVSIAENNKTASAGYLYLKEGSTFAFGTEGGTLTIGGKGVGVLDTEIPLDFTGKALKLGNGGSASGAYLKLRKNASLSGLPTLAIANVQYGNAFLEMYDHATIDGVSIFECGDSAGCDVGISLADNACITNVRTIRAATTMGTRKGGRFSLALSDNAKIVFTNATEKGNTIKFYNRNEARGDFFFGGNSRIEGIESFTFACDQTGDFGGTARFEGGTMVYRMTYGDVAFNLGQARSHADATMRLSGYGKVTRDDLASPNGNRILMYCDFPEFRIEADGMGEKRDLDLAAVGRFNAAYQSANAGTNGWFAVNKGRLVYPRANKDLGGYTAAQPERTVGDYSLPGVDGDGNPNPPTLFGSFNVHFQFLANATGNKAYLYAAQYAADRDDYPTPERFETCKVLNIYRLGAASGWTDDEPQNPYAFKTVDCNFCYDTTGLSGTVPVNLYYNTGKPGARWRKVASNVDNQATGLIRSPAVAPVDGAVWNIGWYAVVEGELTSNGMMLIFR